MSNWRESSAIVRGFRWAARDSLILAPFRAAGRWFAAIDQTIARAAADKAAADDDRKLREVLRDSRVFNALDRLFAAPELAWRDSRSRAFVESLRSEFLALPPAQRVRLIGWMIVVALATRIALYVFSRAPITSITVGLWGLVLLAGIVMLAAPGQVFAAWSDWRKTHFGEK